FEFCTPGDDFFAEADEALDDIAQRQRLWTTAADRQHVRWEAGLRRRVPPQLVEDYFRRGVALQVDNNAHALAIRLIADVGDTLNALVLRCFGDLLDQAVLADLVGNFGEDDRAPVAASFLDVVPGPHHDRAPTRGVGAADPRQTEDESARWEIRALHVLHQPFRAERGVLNV